MEQINIIYVDDDLDLHISKYLTEEYTHENLQKKYNEICFKSEEGYENLINEQLVKEANVIFIDSKLFENDNVSKKKFSGEEFKIILKKVYPFIEVIVITQNEITKDYGTLSKYSVHDGGTPKEYYERELKTVLDSAIRNINIYNNISAKLKSNEGIDKMLIEKILCSINGTSQYDELTTKDINAIIDAFKEIQRDIDEK